MYNAIFEALEKSSPKLQSLADFTQEESKPDFVRFSIDKICKYYTTFSSIIDFKLICESEHQNRVFDCQILLDKNLEVYESRLIKAYTELYPQLVDLVLLLKDWNKKTFPLAEDRIKSHCIVLMAIFFLQSKCIIPAI